MSDLMLDVGQAVELKEAFRRGDWTNAEIKKLCEGDLLQQVRTVVRGAAEIKQIKRLARGVTTDLLERAQVFRPADYFQTKDSLYVWDGFTNRVVGAANEVVQTTSAATTTSFDLVVDSIDEQIRAELPEGHVFQDASVFCSHLAGIIDRQPNGKEGPLLSNGYANIFYVNVGDRVVAVRVYWRADDRRWRVDACELDVSTWSAGHRAFSAIAVA